MYYVSKNNFCMFQFAVLLLASFFTIVAPRPSSLVMEIDKIQTELTHELGELRTHIDKREADPIPPIGSCGC